MELPIEAAIRTGDDGQVELQVGDAAIVTIEEDADVAVAEVSEKVSRIMVGDGRVSARMTPGGGAKFRMEFTRTGGVAETEGGEFAALSGSDGVVVAASSGSVDVSSSGKTVQVAAGEQTTVRKQNQPTTPARIPTSLFLKVKRPEARSQRARETVVEGQTVPGALVSVNGIRQPAAADGRFAIRVPLKDGDNPIAVKVKDASGRRQSETLSSISVDTRAPPVKSDVEW
jgi:hypothetical protein